MTRAKVRLALLSLSTVLWATSTMSAEPRPGVVAPRAKLTKVGDDYQFTEGPAADAQGNVCMAEKGIVVYDSAGKCRERIEVPHEPTNLCFAVADRRTLFITARPAIYTLRMRVAGAQVEQQPGKSRN